MVARWLLDIFIKMKVALFVCDTPPAQVVTDFGDYRKQIELFFL